MLSIFQALLAIHILGGTLSILLGFYILCTKKGDKRHTLVGNIFFYSMLIAAVVALPMSYLHPNYFLFIISIFTSYMLMTGKRYLKIKDVEDIQTKDWLLMFIMLFFGLAFIIFGMYHIFNNNYFGIVFIVFGGISLVFIYQDYQNFKGQPKVKNFWLIMHLQRMVGSYIAAVTAFLVVNNKILPAIVAWLLPTLLLTPLIARWTRKYQIKKKHI